MTTVFVTHDQTEAIALADRIAVMEDGVLQQFATPEELKERPANLFVASFIGEPPMNIFDAGCARRTALAAGARPDGQPAFRARAARRPALRRCSATGGGVQARHPAAPDRSVGGRRPRRHASSPTSGWATRRISASTSRGCFWSP